MKNLKEALDIMEDYLHRSKKNTRSALESLVCLKEYSRCDFNSERAGIYKGWKM